MKTVYLDADYVCHLSQSIGSIPYETDFFDDKCDSFIEGYRIVPEGRIWRRNDGAVFNGLMISPAINTNYLIGVQTQFEKDNTNMILLEDVAELVEMIYEDDLGVIG